MLLYSIQKFGVSKIFFLNVVFEISYAHKGQVYLIKNIAQTNIVTYYYN